MTLHNDSLTQELHLLELLRKTDLRETVLWGFTQVGFIYCFHHVRQRIQVCKNIAVKLLIFCNVGLPFFRSGLRIDGGPFCPLIIRLCASPSGCSFSATSKLFLWPRLRRLTDSSVRRKVARFVAWPGSRDGIGSGTGACLRMLGFRNAKSHIVCRPQLNLNHNKKALWTWQTCDKTSKLTVLLCTLSLVSDSDSEPDCITKEQWHRSTKQCRHLRSGIEARATDVVINPKFWPHVALPFE